MSKFKPKSDDKPLNAPTSIFSILLLFKNKSVNEIKPINVFFFISVILLLSKFNSKTKDKLLNAPTSIFSILLLSSVNISSEEYPDLEEYIH